MHDHSKPSVAIIAAGPAGLTAAYLLSRAGAEVAVLEADPIYVGGISRTMRYNDFRFDIGGHRFFSKSAEVEQLWTEILGARQPPGRCFDQIASSQFNLEPALGSHTVAWANGVWQISACPKRSLGTRVETTRANLGTRAEAPACA